MSHFLSNLLVIVTAIYVVGVLAFVVGLFLPAPPRRPNRRRVSVVVAARNEQHRIGNLLSDLTNQTYPEELYEIIVVDDGSSDRTASIVRAAQVQHPNVRLLHVTETPSWMSPKKYALEQGIRAARGEIILTTDADCRVSNAWIETVLSYFNDDVGMVVGFSQMGRPREKRSLLEKLQALDFLSLMGAAAGACQIRFPLAGSGQNLAYRKEAFLAVGGYSQVGHRVSGDDVLLLQLVRRQTNWKIVFAFDPRAYATTEPEKTLSALLNQRRRWASNGVYQFFLNQPFFLYALNTFTLNLLILLGVPAGLFNGGLGLVGAAFAAKALAELTLLLRAGQLFGRLDLLRVYPLWVVLQIPYVVLVGVGGTFGNFTWKGRPHRAAITPAALSGKEARTREPEEF